MATVLEVGQAVVSAKGVAKAMMVFWEMWRSLGSAPPK
jgi:hypothetical protein